ncbi:MAG: ABC transporter permease [Saprospiraceae bacterium]|nr:ABC transporter permease [Saprospiraceae bacterium]
MGTPLNNHHPPKWADHFLAWFCRDELLEEIKGDLHEFYVQELSDQKLWKAKLYYWYHVLHFLRPFAIKSRRQHSNTLTMYRNYFKFAWRHALKHKGNTILHVLSLGLGIACSIFIFIYLKGELSYDRFHEEADRIHRVAIDLVDSEQRRIPDATTPPALAPSLVKDFPEVASAVRLFPNWGNKFLLGASPEKKFHEEDFIRTDPGFFDVFTFPALHGDPARALEERGQIILTRSAATKYFGKTDVVGESLMHYLSDTTEVYQIGAVLEDVLLHSHFHFDFLAAIPFENLEQNWGWYNYYTYIKLAPGAKMASLEPKLQPYFESQLEERDYYNIIYSQPVTDIHLRSHLKWELEPNGDIANVYILALLALFVLFMSCLNYLNLKIAEVSKKYREVGVRKVFGANKGSLIGQFMVETLLISFFALLFASLLAEGLFRQLRDVLGRDISILDPENLVAFLLIGLVVVGWEYWPDSIPPSTCLPSKLH